MTSLVEGVAVQQGKGFGVSGLRDVLVVLLHESCKLAETVGPSTQIFTAKAGHGVSKRVMTGMMAKMERNHVER